jgi:uncharacterized delta-60 repeat protein
MVNHVGCCLGSDPGVLDPTFADAGKLLVDISNLDVLHDVAVQEDQKIVTVGMSFDPAFVSTAHARRYLADGTPDPSFGTNGVFTYSLNFEANIYACFIKPDGKILLCGETTDYQDYRLLLIQLNADGTLDDLFGVNGVVVEHVSIYEDHGWGLAVLADGAILVCGTGTVDYAGEYRNAPMIVKFTAEGDLDTSFGTNGVATIPVGFIENTFRCIAVQPDGKILAAGHFANDFTFFVTLVVRFMPDGTLDQTFAENGIFKYAYGQADSQAFDLAVTDDGKILVTGVSVTPTYDFSMMLFRLDAQGVPDSDFGTDGLVNIDNTGNYDVGYGLRLQTDNKIVVSGTTGNAPPQDNSMAVWRFNTDGTIDASFGTNGMTAINMGNAADEAMGIALQADKKIVIAGKSRNEANTDFAIVRLLGDQPTTSVIDLTEMAVSLFPNPVMTGSQVSIVYELNSSGSARLEIMDVLGNLVSQIELGQQHSGTQKASFTLPDNICSGIYLVRLNENGIPGQLSKLFVTK